MSWFSSHTVKCYGCDNYLVIDQNEWAKKRASPGNWRCTNCQEEQKKNGHSIEEELLGKRDRSVSTEYLKISGENSPPLVGGDESPPEP